VVPVDAHYDAFGTDVQQEVLSAPKPHNETEDFIENAERQDRGIISHELGSTGVRTMKKSIEIVDRGRGPQLSTSRITVQDLVPYFQERCSHEEIMRWIPLLTREEIQLVEEYMKDHYEEVMEQDRRIRERNAQNKNSPEVEKILADGKTKLLALEKQLLRNQVNGEAE
jgi:uncharacterized protein (DUF433 family)